MSADKYGFRPMPQEGLSILERLLIVAAIAVIAIIGLTIVLFMQQRDDSTRLERLWSQSWQWPDRYHLTAVNQDGEAWEIWFESPNRWYVSQPGGFQVSDGTTVSTYVAEGNFYSQNPVTRTYVDVGIGPLGPRDSEELKRVIASAENLGSGWVVEKSTYLDRPVDIVRMGRSTLGNSGILRSITVDPSRMVVLRESLGDLSGHDTYVEATSVEYDVNAPPGTFVFVSPEGSCRKASSTGPCLP